MPLLSKRVAVTDAAWVDVVTADEWTGPVVLVNHGPNAVSVSDGAAGKTAANTFALKLDTGAKVDPKGSDVVRARCLAGETATIHVFAD